MSASPEENGPPVTTLVAAPPPPAATADLEPDQLELYVRAGMHQERSPGNVLVVCHPLRMYKVPRPLFPALRQAGFELTVVETHPSRVRSVEKIRDALRELAEQDAPLDILVITGDGSLDHHVLVAAFWAFFPDLVTQRPGEIDCSAVTDEDLGTLPADYRQAFFRRRPDCSSLEPDEQTITDLWLLRSHLEGALRKGRPAARILRRAGLAADDVALQVVILAALFPDKVRLRAHGFDLSGLAQASREQTFQGLYPFIRSITAYPAGTAADNAVFSGVPGWGYAQFSRLLTGVSLLEPLREWLEGRVARAFVEYFTRDGVVVPARFSVVGFDGEWQLISSHAAGGPGAGHFFTADLTSKTKGMLGYLIRIPRVVIQEGLFGSTVVRIRSRFANGERKSFVESRLAEGLYTNRTFIAGVGSVPTTGPTSFAGQSSLLVVAPIWYRANDGRRKVDLRGLAAFTEAIAKGVLARALHMTGLGVGNLAGGGKFATMLPQSQVAIKEGEQIEIEYLTEARRPRAVPIQVSGDPFQGWKMDIRMAWGPIPMLGKGDSLLLASTRRALSRVRLRESYRLQGVYIGGMYYFRHHVGAKWDRAMSERIGLIEPPLYLPRGLVAVQARVLEAWQELGTGEFVDTTESGLALGRRGRYAHNNDQTAHLVVLRQPRGRLLVRQVRAGPLGSEVYESRSHYRVVGGAYIIEESQTRVWQSHDDPRILQEDHFFRNAEAFQLEAPSFFPFVASSEDELTLLDTEEVELLR